MATIDSSRTGDESFVRSVIFKRKHVFNWSVENFSKWTVLKSISCPVFYPWQDNSFTATLEKIDDLRLKIQFQCLSGSSIAVKHTYSITDHLGRNFQEHVLKLPSYYLYSIVIKDRDRAIIAYISYPALLEFLADSKCDTFSLKCIMERQEVHTECVPFQFRPKPESLSDNLSALSTDLEAMYSESLHADVSLKVDDSIVRAHKSVMCARSPVFARMFETPMGESEKNAIDITDLDLPVLKDLVSFLYTGTVAKDDFESVYALYYAADKYDVSSLHETCVDVLLSKLDVENACRVLVLAERHSDVEFQDSVLHFVKFYIDKVLETDAFKDLETPLQNKVRALRCTKRKCRCCGEKSVPSTSQSK